MTEARRPVQRLPELWPRANLTGRQRLLLTVLDAVYVDARDARAVVSVRPKAAFATLLTEAQVLTASGPPVRPAERRRRPAPHLSAARYLRVAGARASF